MGTISWSQTMNRHFFFASFALFFLSAVSTTPAHAQEIAARGREIFKKHQGCVVTVQLVVKSKLGIAGLGNDSHESKQEVTGTIIDPSGLTVLSLSSTDPSSLFQGFMF